MLKQLLRYAGALGQAWFALMSSAVFTFIAIYAAYFNRNNTWVVTASVIAALLAFVVASFLAWRDEHVAKVATQELLQSQLPDFELKIGQALSTHYPGPDLTIVILAIELMNRGADSAALRWEAHYVSGTFDAGALVVHPGTGGVKMGIPDGGIITITSNDLIQAKVLPTIPRGNLVTGRLVLQLPGDKATEIRTQQASIVVSCEDYNHRRYSAYFNPSSAQQKLELLLHERLG